MSPSTVIFAISAGLIVTLAVMWSAMRKGSRFPTWLLWTIAVLALAITVYTDRGKFWQTATVLTNLGMLFGISAPLIQRYRGKW
jgi:hypothetical protein